MYFTGLQVDRFCVSAQRLSYFIPGKGYYPFKTYLAEQINRIVTGFTGDRSDCLSLYMCNIHLVGSSVFGESKVVGVAVPLGGAEVNVRWALPV